MQIGTSRAARFFWRPDGRPSAAPSVTFGAPISETKVLAKLRSDATVASVGADLQTVTLNPGVGASSRGLIGHEGVAWLDLGQAGQFPVRIAAFDSSTAVRLADRLPYAPGASAAGTLSWNVWYADLAADEVGAAVARRVTWSIPWTATEGTDHPGEPRHDRGLLDIVVTPFSTGCGPDDLHTLVPLLSQMVPGRQRSWTPQVQMALREIVGWIEEVLPRGRFIDQLAGDQFMIAHALLSAHYVLQGHRAVGYSRPDVDFLADARIEFARQSKRLRWLDANSDGVVDSGETDVGTGRVYQSTPSALWTESDFDEPTFEGQR